MDGFKRPQKRLVQKTMPPKPTNMSVSPSLPIVLPPSIKSPEPPVVAGRLRDLGRPASRPKKSKRWLIVAFVVGIVVAVAIAIGSWYTSQLKPVAIANTETQRVVIEKSTSFGYVVKRLKERGLIRSELAATVYGLLSGTRTKLKEGSCDLAPSQSTQQILEKLTTGCHDFKVITFFPGATIERPLYKPSHAELDDTMYVKYRLQSFGFSDDQISAALTKQYSGPLFADKPAGTSLEGYIYGQTYFVEPGVSAEKVLQTTFDQMYKELNAEGLPAKFQSEGLSLYQAITLASIVQRELNCEGKPTEGGRQERCYTYQRTIAQIFLKRLRENISLGSDVTFIYAADIMGVAPSVTIDSPYNTRIHTGLPPGPIGAPGILALRAVANPTSTDYLFFIAGDDGLIYFASDQAGHEANIAAHCQKLCNEL